MIVITFREKYKYKAFNVNDIEYIKYIVRDSEAYMNLEEKIILDFGNFITSNYPNVDFTLIGRMKSLDSYLNKLNNISLDGAEAEVGKSLMFDQIAWTLIVNKVDNSTNSTESHMKLAYNILDDFFESDYFKSTYHAETFDIELKDKANGYRAKHLSISSKLLPYFFLEFHSQSREDYVVSTSGSASHDLLTGKGTSLKSFYNCGSLNKMVNHIKNSLPRYRVYVANKNSTPYIYHLTEAENFYKYFKSNLSDEPELFKKFLNIFYDEELEK